MNLITYLTSSYALVAVTLPLSFTIGWLTSEALKNPPKAKYIWIWMLSVIFSYMLSTWKITPETISLHIMDVFLIYLIFHLKCKEHMTAHAAFSLSFLGLLTVDVTRALELISSGLVGPSTWYYGIGGAGIYDGLIIFPLLAAFFVRYITWRQRNEPVYLNARDLGDSQLRL